MAAEIEMEREVNYALLAQQVHALGEAGLRQIVAVLEEIAEFTD